MPLSPADKRSMVAAIRTCLANFSPPMVISKQSPDGCEWIGNIPVPYGSTKKIVPGMYFASVVTRKDSVNFYFFPLYNHEEDFIPLIPALIKSLKGKTCFIFKKPEQIIPEELEALVRKGVRAWKKNGYLQ